MKRTLLLSLALLVLLASLAPSALAEEKKAEKKGYAYYEYQFGIKLITYGFWNLAEKHFQNYLKDPKIPKDLRPKGYLGLAILYKARGQNRKATPKQREEYFDKALANLEEFLQKWPNKDTVEYRSAQVEKYGIEIDRVEAKINELEGLSLKDPERKAKEAAASAKLREAINELVKIHAAIREERAKFEDSIYEDCEKRGVDPPDYIEFPDEMNQRWYSIAFVLARAYLLYPRIYVRGTEEFKKALDFSLTGLEDFVWEHDNDSVYIYGGIFLGRLYADKLAITKDPEERQKYKNKVDSAFNDYVFAFGPDVYRQLREQAYNEYAEILLEIGSASDIIEKVWNRYTKDYPNWLDDTMYGEGYKLAAKVALAMLSENEATEAVDLLTKVIDKANLRQYSSAASEASKALATIIEKLGPENMDIKTLLQAGKGFKGKGDWATAISYYQYVIQGLDRRLTEEDLKQYDPKVRKKVMERYQDIEKRKVDIAVEAFENIAECFNALGMPLEAVVAANEAVSRYASKLDKAFDKDAVRKNILRAAKLAHYLARKLFFAQKREGVLSDSIGKLYMIALDNIEKVDESARQRVLFELGQIKQMFGDYEQAIAAYKKVAPDSDKYGDAQYNICFCYYKLSKNAEEKGDQAAKEKYQVQAVDSLKAVIDMKRKWGPEDAKKKRSWERKRSLCFMLLAQIYDALGNDDELIALAEKWMQLYTPVFKDSPDYVDHAISLNKYAIEAAIKKGDVQKAEALYTALKKLILGDNPTEVPANKTYNVSREVGARFVDIALSLAKAFEKAGDAEKQKYFAAESTKWQVIKTRDPVKLYAEMRKYEKTPDIYVRIGKDILSLLNDKMKTFTRKQLLAEDIIKAIYFPGDKKKTDQMRKLYKDFVNVFLGAKLRLKGKRVVIPVNYYKAKKAFDELEKLDPDKKTDFWRATIKDENGTTVATVSDLKKQVNYYYLRHLVYKRLWKPLMDQGDYETASKVLDYLVNYYKADDEYKMQAALAFRRVGRWEDALGLYGELIVNHRKGAEQCKYRYLVALTHFEHAQAVDKPAEKKDLLQKAIGQLNFIKGSYPEAYTQEMEKLRTRITAILNTLK